MSLEIIDRSIWNYRLQKRNQLSRNRLNVLLEDILSNVAPRPRVYTRGQLKAYMKESRSCGSDEYTHLITAGLCFTELLISNEGGLHDIASNPIEKIANTYPFIITRLRRQ